MAEFPNKIVLKASEQFRAPPSTPEFAAVRAALRAGALETTNLDQIEWCIARYAPELLGKWRAARHTIRKNRKAGDVFVGEVAFSPRDVMKIYAGAENRHLVNNEKTHRFITFSMNSKYTRRWFFRRHDAKDVGGLFFQREEVADDGRWNGPLPDFLNFTITN